MGRCADDTQSLLHGQSRDSPRGPGDSLLDGYGVSPTKEREPLLGLGAFHEGGLPPTFWQRWRKRSAVLIALLIFQSCSSFILSSYEVLLQRHSVIVFFLTMLVGAGGNAGNQAAVLVIRGLATGEINSRNAASYVLSEFKMAVCISTLMVGAGYMRVILFGYSELDALAISASLLVIVLSSVIIGCTLPLLLHRMHLDPAHAGATIQVIMDLAGVCITCLVCSLMLKGEAADGVLQPLPQQRQSSWSQQPHRSEH